MVYAPARVAEPTGKARWPLDARVDVIVSVDAASKALNDLKVRGHFPKKSPRKAHPPSRITRTQPNPEGLTPTSTRRFLI